MKNLFFCMAIICMHRVSFAQTKEFRINPSDKLIILRLDQVSADVVGYDGNEVIIKAISKTDKDTTGLKQLPIYGRNAIDNIINPKVQQVNNALRITVPPGNFKHLLIKVPQQAVISVEMLAFLNENKLTVNHVNEIYIGAIVGDIEVNDVAFFSISSGGAIAGRRMSDKIVLSNIRWSDEPVYLNGQPRPRIYHVGAGSASITLLVPDTLKSDIFFTSRNGRVLSGLQTTPPDAATDKSIIASQFPTDADVRHISQNGGGIKVSLSNDYGNIYLKKEGK
nr:hypothetical protein [Mucilaginibacter sp. L294]